MAITTERLSYAFSPEHIEHMQGMLKWTNLVGQPAEICQTIQAAAKPIDLGPLADTLQLAIQTSFIYPKNRVESQIFTWVQNTLNEKRSKFPPLTREEMDGSDFYPRMVSALAGKYPQDVARTLKIKRQSWGEPEMIGINSPVDIPSLLECDETAMGRPAFDIFPYGEDPENTEQMAQNTQVQTAIARTLGILKPEETWADFIARSNLVEDRHQGSKVEVKNGKTYLAHKGDFNQRDEHGVLGLKRNGSFKDSPDLFIVSNLKYSGVEALVGFSIPRPPVRNAGDRREWKEIDQTLANAFEGNLTSPMIRLIIPTTAFFQAAA